MNLRNDDYFLGIDLGTSALKTALVDAGQSIIATTSQALETLRRHPTWSEQDPQVWWEALSDAITTLRASAPREMQNVTAIGLSGQMHGLVVTDEQGHFLRPAILWNDSRAHVESAELAARFPQISALCGTSVSPSFYPPKLLWLRTHEPDLFKQSLRFMPPKDYLRLRMTGSFQTDASDAAATLCMDVAARSWSPQMLDITTIGISQLPEIIEGSSRGATLLPDIARKWQMRSDAFVAGGAGDSAAGAIGVGVVNEGDVVISLGTSAQIFRCTERYRPVADAGMQSFAHALPDRWFQAAAILNGASSLAWATKLLGYDDPAILITEAERHYRGPSDILCLPYLNGERSPHYNPHARGVFFGCAPETMPRDIIQAVMEGLAYTLAGAYESFAAAGKPISEAALIGGGARNVFWTHMIANVIGIPIVRYTDAQHGPAFGAARLARIAYTGEPVGSVAMRPAILDRSEPDTRLHKAYRQSFMRWLSLYEALQAEFMRNT